MNNWTLIYPSKSGYYYWKHSDGYYNVTQSNTPPTTEAGYNSLIPLMSLKNENWLIIQEAKNQLI